MRLRKKMLRAASWYGCRRGMLEAGLDSIEALAREAAALDRV